MDPGCRVFIRSAARTHTNPPLQGPESELHFTWLHEGTRIGGSDRRRGVLMGTAQGGFARGIRMAFIR